MDKRQKIIFAILILLGIFVRVVYLGKIPSGFFRDEAALGYNAYSILKTGKDEYGYFSPVVFRSFEVFFLPLYVYITTPIVKLLGLTEFSTRLISSLSGIIQLVLIYAIGKKLWNKKAGLFSLFCLVIAPWAIFYSRGAFEGNLGLTFFAAGFFFFLKFTEEKNIKNFFLFSLFFIFSMYSYQAPRLVALLFILSSLAFHYKDIFKIKKKLILPSTFLVILLLPMFYISFLPGGFHRAIGVSVFSKNEQPPGWVEGTEKSFIVNNSIYLRARQITSLYLSYYSFRNLFFEGDDNRQRTAENFSVFYAWMLPFVVLGAYSVIKKMDTKNRLLLIWTAFAPIPAAMTGDPFHTYRSLLLFFPLTLLAGYGLYYCFHKTKLKKAFLTLFFLFSISSFSLYLYDYFVISNKIRAKDWDYGYKEMVNYIISLSGYDKVVVDDPWTESYIHFLFFAKVDPKIYHKEVEKLGNIDSYYYKDASVIRPLGFNNFEFKDVDWALVRGDRGTIFVLTPQELPASEFENDPKVKVLKEIYYPDNTLGFRIVKIE